MARDPFERACRPGLGIFVDVALHRDELAGDTAARRAAFDAAYAAIDAVERQMSFHDPASSLSRLNRAAPGATVRVPAWTYAVLALAADVFRATGGRFDCGVGRHLVAAGLLPAHDPAVARSSIAHLRLDGNGRVAVTDRVRIDLGGIAKGFAVDRAVEAMLACGVRSCIVNAGGDLRVAGAAAQRVVIRHSRAPATRVALGDLADGAVATSSPAFSTVGEGDAARCVLFDPAGRSLTQMRSYSVVAPTCALADALTKAVAVAFDEADAAGATGHAYTGALRPFEAAFLAPFGAVAYVL
jgi:thiamine biosynthesis lipoprotein